MSSRGVQPFRLMAPLTSASLALLMLSACSSPPPPEAPPPQPVQEVVDGFYRGTSTRFQANSRACPRPGLVSVQVWDRRFQYRWSYGVLVDAVIQPDGTIEGQGTGISLLGKYTPNRIQGDITNGDCGLHFTLTLRDK
jgi:hypothetical protein